MPSPSSTVKVTETELMLYKPYSIPLQISSAILSISIRFGYIMEFAGQDTSHHFKKENLTASFGLVILFCAMISSIIASRYFPKTKHSYKILTTSVIRTISYSLLYYSLAMENLEIGFWLNILGSALYGCCSSVDQTVLVGYIKTLPPYCYTAYSSADGFSGLFTVLLYLILKYFGLDLGFLFLLFLPTNILILVLFYWMEYTKHTV